MTAVLWHIGVSHYNEKVRWALDYKRVPHVRRAVLPGPHGLVAFALTRGAGRRLPILQLDGRAIEDSTAIIAALEAYRPDPPLYPEDPADRARALALEDFFDEGLGPAMRAFAFHHTLQDPDLAVRALVPGAGAARRRRVLRAILPAVQSFVRRDYDASAEAMDGALATIRAAMDRVEEETARSGYLVGDRFTVADLTAATLFTPVLAPPQRPHAPRRLPPRVMELSEELAAREGGAWVFEMYARHRGAPAAAAA